MFTRYVLVGLVLAGCGKSDASKQPGVSGSAAAQPVAGAPPAPVAPTPRVAAARPVAPASPPAVEPPPAGSNAAGSNARKDEPVKASTSAERDELDRAIAPYSEQARKSYPDAK